MRKLEGGEKLPWLRAGNSLVPDSEWPPNPVYPRRAAGKIKEALTREGVLRSDGERKEGVEMRKGGERCKFIKALDL